MVIKRVELGIMSPLKLSHISEPLGKIHYKISRQCFIIYKDAIRKQQIFQDLQT